MPSIETISYYGCIVLLAFMGYTVIGGIRVAIMIYSSWKYNVPTLISTWVENPIKWYMWTPKSYYKWEAKNYKS